MALISSNGPLPTSLYERLMNSGACLTYLVVRQVRVVDRRRLVVFSSLVNFATMHIDQSSIHPNKPHYIEVIRHSYNLEKNKKITREKYN